MRAYWTDRKVDGTPITDGRLCRVIDAEDGTNPIRVYGRTAEEVFEKIERTMSTAQSKLVEVKQQNGTQKPVNFGPVAGDPPPDPRILSADEIMELTRDQQNPVKAPAAAARLSDHHHALQEQTIRHFAEVSRAWQANHPELVDNLFNKKLITDNARMRVNGDLKLITAEVLEAVYNELNAGGYLVTEAPQPAQPSNEPTPALPADGNPSPVPARNPSPTFATSHRSTRLGPSQVATWKPKYTIADLNKLTTKQTLELNDPRNPGHKDYVDACNYWYPQAQATA